jgi:hypothetical protein
MEIEMTDNETHLKELLKQQHAGRERYYNARLPLEIKVIKNGKIWELEVSLSLDIAHKEGYERISGTGGQLDEAVVDFQKAWERYVDECFECDREVFNR